MTITQALNAILDILANSSRSPAFGGPGESGWVDALSSVLSAIGV